MVQINKYLIVEELTQIQMVFNFVTLSFIDDIVVESLTSMVYY